MRASTTNPSPRRIASFAGNGRRDAAATPYRYQVILQRLGEQLSQSTGDHALDLARMLVKLPGADPGQLRPVFEQFLLLPELRDPSHYRATKEDGGVNMNPITQRGLDDQKRQMAANALGLMGESARDSLPALAELAQRTDNDLLREQVFQAIALLDPDRHFETPELTEARRGWDQDRAFFESVTSGTATLEDLRRGLGRNRTAAAAATLLAKRDDSARELAPDLVDALTRTGSYEVAQALKKLAPEQLVQCLKNPAAFTLQESFEFKAHPERDALIEAAQALAELGPSASFALPTLREALEIPDHAWVRLTLDKTICTIDPQATPSVYSGSPIATLNATLIQARDDAEASGQVERARLADATAMRMELNHGMTRKELVGIAAELKAADPTLHAIYRQALAGAIPDLESNRVGSP